MNHPHYHSTALVESKQIGTGTRVWAFAHICDGAIVGSNCNIGDHGYIESGARVGDNVTLKNHVCVWDGVSLDDDVFVGPYVAFTNDRNPRSPRMEAVRPRYADKQNWLSPTIVERGATIGANATIVAGVRLGRFCFVAAGSTVTTDVAPYALVAGIPARQVGQVCECGIPLTSDAGGRNCAECASTAENAAAATDKLTP